MIEPMLADGVELAAEPAADDVDRDAPVCQVVDGRNLLGRESWVPWPRQEGGDHLQRRRGFEQRVAESHRLMLEFCAVTGGEANLAQGVLKAAGLGDLRKFAIVLDGPARALFNIGNDQAARDVWNPIGEFESVS